MLKRAQAIRQIRLCIWIYFWLLIFEGTLRKWIVPQLSTPLLLIRDPFTLYACWMALRLGMFRRDLLFQITILVAWLLTFGSLFASFHPDGTNLPAILFGLRTNFLHLIMMFLIPKVFDQRDVKQMGFWFLLLSLLMGVLMFLQFNAPGTAFINAGAGVGSGEQITGGSGRIRPAGTFTFITGPSLYYPCVTAFSILGLMQRGLYPRWLLICSGFSTLAAVIFSGGSRGLILGVVLVFVGLAAGLALEPRRLAKLMAPAVTLILLAGVGYLVFRNADAVETGVAVIQDRGFGDILQRVLLDFYPISQISNTPLLGFGLGTATNAGRTLLSGGGPSILFEGEWGRVIVESGVIFGSIYILLRILLTVWVGLIGLAQAKQANFLPILLYGACGYNLLSGQFGQTTALGFAALVGGLSLASARIPATSPTSKHSLASEFSGSPAPEATPEPALPAASFSSLYDTHEDPTTG